MPNKVNEQVVDAINLTNQTVLGDAPAVSYGTALQSFALATSQMMLNAVTVRSYSAQITNAAVVQTCAKILSAGAFASAQSAAEESAPPKPAA